MERRKRQKPADTVAPVPLVVAVTGHRDLVAAEIPELQRLTKEFLESTRASCGDTPLVVLSPLAEGAGQLVANEALALGLRLIVPLPLPIETYRESLSSGAGIREFDRLTREADVFELPLLPGTTEADVAEPGPARDRHYAQLGVYLSGHCHLLLALWDGKPSDQLGGTAQVVQYHHTDFMPDLTERRKPARHLVADLESDLVYHIVCSRDQPDGAPEAGLQPLQSSYLTFDPGNPRTTVLPEAYRLMFRRTCEFNRDTLKYEKNILRHECRLLSDAKKADVPVRARKIAALFRTADFLARHFQVRVNVMLQLTYTLAVLMGLAFIFYADVEGFEYMVYVFLILFGIGLLIYLIATKREWQRKYLDYRSLAEGVRVQFYWLVAGVASPTRTQFAHDNFLQKQEVELGWIRNVMRVSTIGQQQSDVRRRKSDLQYAIHRWIGDPTVPGDRGQISYFKRHQHHKLRLHRITSTLAFACLWAGIGVTLVLAAFDAWLAENTREALLVLMGVLPLIAAVREAYSHKKADKELIKQYRFMRRLYQNAKLMLDAADTDAEKREVLWALGEAALDEHAEWILMHRERPLEHGWL